MASTLLNVSARNAAFALYQLNQPAVHPYSVIRCVEFLTSNSPAISDVVRSDPAVALTIFKLCREHNVEPAFDSLDFDSYINKIPKSRILKTFLSVKTFDIDNLHSQLPLVWLNNISAARAYAAYLIAEKTDVNQSLAFFAALFSDIGLFALAELYPKSMSRLLAQSSGDNEVLLRLEKENIGLTHNIISRQLAQKWLLPQVVADCGWLYCTPAIHKLTNIANIDIIITVRQADILVKNINNSCKSFLPSLSQKGLDEIKEKTRNFLAALNDSQGKQHDRVFRQAIISLVEKADGQNFAEFQSKIWNAVKPAVSAVEAAAIICTEICRIFDAQKACIFLNAKKECVKTVSGKTEFLTFSKSPTLADIDFEENQTSQTDLGGIGLLFVESANDFDYAAVAQTIVQILSAKSIEEYHLSIMQCLLDDGTLWSRPVPQSSTEKESAFTEKIVQSSEQMREIIAEIAAGAAHEINNPLTVISGRAQLLMKQETDETKLLMLNQIMEKTSQAYEIVHQLMRYARPAKPNIRTVSPVIIINNCLEKINAHYLNEPLDITIDSTIENLSDVEADAEQIAEAMSQIICNSLESYESGNGPVIIAGSEHKPGFIDIRIQDQGCGMTPQTLQKAAEPFYSDKPAGRQRGMGLALASSLIRNNGGEISLESQIEKGTTVTIRLPKTAKSQ